MHTGTIYENWNQLYDKLNLKTAHEVGHYRKSQIVPKSSPQWQIYELCLSIYKGRPGLFCGAEMILESCEGHRHLATAAASAVFVSTHEP